MSEGSLEELFRRLRDPDERSRMKEAMVAETARIAADTAVCRWDEVRLARVLSEQNSHFQGLTIGEISRRRGTDPETTVMDLVLEERCQATMYRIFRQTDDLATAVVHPLTMIETDAMGFVEGNPSIGQYGSSSDIRPNKENPPCQGPDGALSKHPPDTILHCIKTRRAVRSNPRELRLRVRLRQLFSFRRHHA